MTMSMGRRIGAAAVVWLATVGAPTGQGSALTLELVNGFGVSKQLVPRSSLPLETGTDIVDGACTRAILPVRLAANVVACVPAWDLDGAKKGPTGKLQVTLKSGRVMEGTAFGTIVSGDGLQRDSLNAVQAFRVSLLPPDYQRSNTNGQDQAEMKDSPDLWVMSAQGQELEIRYPQFWFRYYSSDGYIMGGTTRTGRTASVIVKKGAEELEGPLSDFTEIVLRTAAAGTAVTVKTSTGIVTEGTLSLHAKDGKGRHDASAWSIGGVLAGTSLTRVSVSDTAVTLRRK